MSAFEFALRALAVFIFANHGPAEVVPVAIFALALWTVAAFAYIALLEPEPRPLFFGVPAHRAQWQAKPFPRKWLVAFAIAAAWLLWRVLYP